MKNRNLVLLVCLTLLSGVLITACKSKTVSDKPKIFVTIEPLRYFAEQIAGHYFDIESMVPKGNNPETYDPTPRQLMALADSKAYLSIGNLGFEKQWIPKLKENASNVKFCDTSLGINHLESSHRHENKDDYDPHIWTTPSNAAIIVKNISNLFCELDPQHQEEYIKNQMQLLTMIQQTDAEIRGVVSDGIQETFAIYHPSLTYFAHDYGIEQLCIEDNGKEPSPVHLKELINQCRSEQVKVVFVQQEFNTHNAEIIANELKAKLVTINPLNYNWQEEIIKIARNLKK